MIIDNTIIWCYSKFSELHHLSDLLPQAVDTDDWPVEPKPYGLAGLLCF